MALLYGNPNQITFTFDAIYDNDIGQTNAQNKRNLDKNSIMLGRFVLTKDITDTIYNIDMREDSEVGYRTIGTIPAIAAKQEGIESVNVQFTALPKDNDSTSYVLNIDTKITIKETAWGYDETTQKEAFIFVEGGSSREVINQSQVDIVFTDSDEINFFTDSQGNIKLGLKNSSIQTEKLANNSINSDKLKNESVTTQKLVDNAITTQKINDGSITTSKIAGNSITEDKLSTNSVTTDKLANSVITKDKLSTNSVTTDKIVDNSITKNKLSANSVTADKIVNNSIITDKIANNSIITSKISFTSEEISNWLTNLGLSSVKGDINKLQQKKVNITSSYTDQGPDNRPTLNVALDDQNAFYIQRNGGISNDWVDIAHIHSGENYITLTAPKQTEVDVTSSLTEGVHIGDITINGKKNSLYAPPGGGGTGDVTQSYLEENYYTQEYINENYHNQTYINNNYYDKTYIDEHYLTALETANNYVSKTDVYGTLSFVGFEVYNNLEPSENLLIVGVFDDQHNLKTTVSGDTEIKDVPYGRYTIHKIITTTDEKFTIDNTYPSIVCNVGYKTIETIDVSNWASYTFASNSWTRINYICSQGLAQQYWNPGDTHPVYLNGKEYYLEIIGFNHDTINPVLNDSNNIMVITDLAKFKTNYGKYADKNGIVTAKYVFDEDDGPSLYINETYISREPYDNSMIFDDIIIMYGTPHSAWNYEIDINYKTANMTLQLGRSVTENDGKYNVYEEELFKLNEDGGIKQGEDFYSNKEHVVMEALQTISKSLIDENQIDCKTCLKKRQNAITPNLSTSADNISLPSAQELFGGSTNETERNYGIKQYSFYETNLQAQKKYMLNNIQSWNDYSDNFDYAHTFILRSITASNNIRVGALQKSSKRFISVGTGQSLWAALNPLIYI